MSFQITVEPSGRTFSADSSETLLAAGIRQGIGLPYGCKDGACGSCKCKKISGTVVHGEHQVALRGRAAGQDQALGFFFCAQSFGLVLTMHHRTRNLLAFAGTASPIFAAIGKAYALANAGRQ